MDQFENPELEQISYRSVNMCAVNDTQPLSSPIEIIDNYKSGKEATDISTHSVIPRIGIAISIPKKPIMINATHFECDMPLSEAVFTIEYQLEIVLRASYAFSKKYCKWESTICRGPLKCVFAVSMYQESEESALTIEFNCLSGDYPLFYHGFGEIQKCFIKDSRCRTFSADAMSPQSLPTLPDFSDDGVLPPPASDWALSSLVSTDKTSEIMADEVPVVACYHAEVEDALGVVMETLSCPSTEVDSLTEALGALYHTSLEQSMHMVMSSTGCVQGLVNIFLESIEREREERSAPLLEQEAFNRHLAICTLANISSTTDCGSAGQEVLLRSTAFMSQLFQLATDGPVHTSELRQECARILCNLSSSSLAKHILASAADEAAGRKWMDTVETVQDERLKFHAMKAKMNLIGCTGP